MRVAEDQPTNPYGFTDETLIGPYMADGFFFPAAAREVAREQLSAALRRLQAQKNYAHIASRAEARTKTKLPPNAPRKRAPKTPRLPAVIDPKDHRMVLKAQGYRAATGVRYFMALLRLQGPGSDVVIPASTNLPAHRLMASVHHAARGEWNPRLHLSLCTETLGVKVRWLSDEEDRPRPHTSHFGVSGLKGVGEFVDIPLSLFPPKMHRTARMRAVYLDHALSRSSKGALRQIDVLCEDAETKGRLTAVLKDRAHDLTKPVPFCPVEERLCPPSSPQAPRFRPDASLKERQEINREVILATALRNVPFSREDFEQSDSLRPLFM